MGSSSVETDTGRPNEAILGSQKHRNIGSILHSTSIHIPGHGPVLNSCKESRVHRGPSFQLVGPDV